MFHPGMPVCISLTIFCLFCALIVDQRIKAHRRAQGKERKLWFEYACLADQTARELRGK